MKISVTAKAGANAPSIKKTGAAHFIVAVKEPAQDNKANIAIVKALAEHFDIAPSQVTLIRGATGRNKIFEIS